MKQEKVASRIKSIGITKRHKDRTMFPGVYKGGRSYLRRAMARMAMSAGVIPGIRAAWPTVVGRMVNRWWRASALRPLTLE